MRRVGRLVALVFTVWLLGLLLAGLGIIPSGVIPLGGAVSSPAPAPAPATLTAIPVPRAPSASALTPAAPLRATASISGGGSATSAHSSTDSPVTSGGHLAGRRRAPQARRSGRASAVALRRPWAARRKRRGAELDQPRRSSRRHR